MQKILLSTLLLLSLGNTSAFACSCGDWTPFVNNFTDPKSYAKDPIAVLVENIERDSYGVRVKVLQVLTGKLEAKEISIFGDNGMSCNGPVNTKIGDVWVAAIEKYRNGDNKYGTLSCSETSLKVTKGNSGETQISIPQNHQEPKNVNVSEFINLLNTPMKRVPSQLTCGFNAYSTFDTTERLNVFFQDTVEFSEDGVARFHEEQIIKFPTDTEAKNVLIDVEVSPAPSDPSKLQAQAVIINPRTNETLFPIHTVDVGDYFRLASEYWQVNVKDLGEGLKVSSIRKGVANIQKATPTENGHTYSYYDLPVSEVVADPSKPGPQQYVFNMSCNTEYELKPAASEKDKAAK